MQTEEASYTCSTEEFARLNLVRATTVRARLSAKGDYFGVRPMKLANGRTAWPAVQVEKTTEVAA